MQKNNSKTIQAWAMYDWANSVYSLVITTAIFPGYFYAMSGGKNAVVQIFGTNIANTVLYTWALSIAFMFVACINPLLSSLADMGGNKKKFMQFFCFLGSASCASLFFFTKDSLFFGVSMFIMAGIGWAGSLVFYNSFLPEIATEDKFDKVSAKGFSLGYIGSVILLVINLIMVQLWQTIGFETQGMAVRYSFLMVGVWWFGFSLITFSALPCKTTVISSLKNNILKDAKLKSSNVWNEVKQLPLLKKFLLSFLFYSMGVQTVMYVATLFGEDVVGMKQDQLITLVLILQLVAVVGAYLFSKISEVNGNIYAIKTSVLAWTLICICAFLMEKGMVIQFYTLGVFVGMMMGAIQSMSRSTYAKLIPKETTNTASYFSFYETIEKFSVSVGALVFGLINALTGSMHYSALALGIFFILGFLFIYKIPSLQIYNTSLKNEN